MKNREIKKLPTRCYKIYTYLKTYCVGYDNARLGRQIVEDLKTQHPDIFGKNYSNLKADIKLIRNHFERKIGSTSKHGYWLMTSQDKINGQMYALNNVLSGIQTLVNSGIKKEVFYKFLNNLRNNNLADNQIRMQVTSSTEKITHTLSDDLINE